jgi:hypothetical protein
VIGRSNPYYDPNEAWIDLKVTIEAAGWRMKQGKAGLRQPQRAGNTGPSAGLLSEPGWQTCARHCP